MSSRPVYWTCAQVAPSGECLRSYKPRAADCSRVWQLLAWLNPSVVIHSLHAGTRCAVVRGSLSVYVCIVLICVWFNKLTLLYFIYDITCFVTALLLDRYVSYFSLTSKPFRGTE